MIANRFQSGFSTVFATACLPLALLAGCSRAALPPSKFIRTTAGGDAVLTADERQSGSTKPAAELALVSFEQPVVVPRPAPLRPVTDWSEEETAADALGRIGVPAVPLLVKALQGTDENARLKAVEVLGRMGSAAKDAVPDLVRLLDDPSERIRKAAARTLGRIGPEAQEAVPALVRSLLMSEGEGSGFGVQNAASGAQTAPRLNPEP